MAIENDPLLSKAEKAQQKQNVCIAYNLNSLAPRRTMSSPLSSYYHNDTVESVIGKTTCPREFLFLLNWRDESKNNNLKQQIDLSGNALDDLHLDDPLGLVDSIHRDTNSPISNSISAGLASSGLLCSSAPVNIPGMAERSVLSNFSPSTSSPLQPLQSAGSFLTSGSRFSHQDSIESVSWPRGCTRHNCFLFFKTFDSFIFPAHFAARQCRRSWTMCRIRSSITCRSRVARHRSSARSTTVSSTSPLAKQCLRRRATSHSPRRRSSVLSPSVQATTMPQDRCLKWVEPFRLYCCEFSVSCLQTIELELSSHRCRGWGKSWRLAVPNWPAVTKGSIRPGRLALRGSWSATSPREKQHWPNNKEMRYN